MVQVNNSGSVSLLAAFLICAFSYSALAATGIGLLKDVVRIDPATQPLIEPEVHHSLQPLPRDREQRGQRLCVAAREAIGEFDDLRFGRLVRVSIRVLQRIVHDRGSDIIMRG